MIAVITIAGYSYYDYHISAMPTVVSTYQPGDIFERSGKDSFEMHGIEWRIFYANQNKGYIVSENLVSKFNCDKKVSNIYLHQENIGVCMNKAQNAYSSSLTNEIMGQIIEEINNPINLSTLRLMNLPEY